MVHTKIVQSHMKVINTLIHACRLICSDAYIKKMIVKVEQNASMAKVRDYLLAVQRSIIEDERFRSLIVYYDVDPQ